MSTTLQMQTNTGLNACPPLCRYTQTQVWMRVHHCVLQMHKRGLKLGLYGDMGSKTCAGYPGSKFFMETDAMTIAEWGVDSFKVDGCYSDAGDFPIGGCQSLQFYFQAQFLLTYVPFFFVCIILSFTCHAWRCTCTLTPSWVSSWLACKTHPLWWCFVFQFTPYWVSGWPAWGDPISVMVFCFTAYPTLGQWLTHTGRPTLCDGVFFSSLPHTGSVAEPHWATDPLLL